MLVIIFTHFQNVSLDSTLPTLHPNISFLSFLYASKWSHSQFNDSEVGVTEYKELYNPWAKSLK